MIICHRKEIQRKISMSNLVSVSVMAKSEDAAELHACFISLLQSKGLNIDFSVCNESGGAIIAALYPVETPCDPPQTIDEPSVVNDIQSTPDTAVIDIEPVVAPDMDQVSNIPPPEPVAAQPEIRTKSGIVFIKSLLPAEPVPYSCDATCADSLLLVNSVAYGKDLITFSYRNVVFKFPIEIDERFPNNDTIRVVFTLDNSEQSDAVYLKVVEDNGDNRVVFGASDCEKYKLIDSF